MKKFLSVILTASMLVAVLMLSSCSSIAGIFGGSGEAVSYGEEIESINGKTPTEVLDELFAEENKYGRYDVKAGMSFSTKVLFFTIKEFESDSIYTYSVDGDKRAIVVSENAEEMLAEAELESPLDGEGQEVVWIDGVCYMIDGNEKYKYNATEFPYADEMCEVYSSDAVKELFSIVSEQITVTAPDGAETGTIATPAEGNTEGESNDIEIEGEGVFGVDLGANVTSDTRCYRTADGYCIVAESKAEMDAGGGVITYAVFLNEECNRVEKIIMDTDLSLVFSLRAVITYEYIYEGLEPVELPEDADAYTENR